LTEGLTGLDKFCQTHFGSGEVTSVRRLSGGASMESWMFSYQDKEMILRRLPQGSEQNGESASLDIGDNEKAAGFIPLGLQAEILQACYSQDIPVPNVVAMLTQSDNLGTGFVMEKLGGEALPYKLLKDEKYALALPQLSAQNAKALASIHKVPLESLPQSLPKLSASQALNNQDEIYQRIGAKVPIFDLAFGWLKTHMPAQPAPCLVHGDFRLGNLLVDAQGLIGVLDWELAHIGDPVRDIAYMCTPSWRFGNYHLQAGGYATRQDWLSDYEKAMGHKVEQDRFNWWLVFNTLWWGISCLLMGNAYRDGSVKTLERTIIGSRVSEVEVDLLLQFEDLRHSPSHTLDWQTPDATPPSQEMSFAEITQAIASWNQDEIMPGSKGLDLFKSRMARNALGIIERQLLWGDVFQSRQKQDLKKLGLEQDALCQDLRQNSALYEDDNIWEHLRLTTLERLSIDQPRYAGFKIAKERWTT